MTAPRRLLLLSTAILLVTGMSARERCERTHLDSPIQINDTVISRPIDIDGAECESLTVEARGALPKLREGRGMSRQCWGIALTAPEDTLKVSLKFGNTDFGDMLDQRVSILTVTRGDEILYNNKVSGFTTAADKFNTLSVTLSEGTLTVSGGGSRSGSLCDITLDRSFTPSETSVWNVGNMLLAVYSTEVCRLPHMAFSTGMTREELDRHFAASTDPVEGYWKYFDRSTDPMFARMGGRYTLAIIRNGEQADSERSLPLATYDIIYIDGAQTMAHDWQPMMLKGSLRATIFDGQYDLTWIDSTFDTMTDDMNATVTDRALLTLSFPLLKSTLRFSKIPVK